MTILSIALYESDFGTISRLADFADDESAAAFAICRFGSVSITACRRTWP